MTGSERGLRIDRRDLFAFFEIPFSFLELDRCQGSIHIRKPIFHREIAVTFKYRRLPLSGSVQQSAAPCSQDIPFFKAEYREYPEGTGAAVLPIGSITSGAILDDRKPQFNNGGHIGDYTERMVHYHGPGFLPDRLPDAFLSNGSRTLVHITINGFQLERFEHIGVIGWRQG
ncbi:MAG: hypothetical protein A2Z99_04975 [Treponema sp. GWB1_62_6]|nr:MAG: hypothetical protein A2Z99_04975 [Treponema sp. GWB1_62_6]